MLKVTLIPATDGQPASVALELSPDAAAMLHELTARGAAPGAQARVLADLYDATGTALALLQQPPPRGGPPE